MTFGDIFRQLHKEYIDTKSRQSSFNKWKEVKGNTGKINVLILKAKADLREGPDNIT